MKKSNILSFIGGVAVALLCSYIFNLTPEKPVVVATTTTVAPAEKECPIDPTIQALPAPIYHSSMAPILEANSEGAFKIRWNQVEYAKSYVLHLYNAEGKQVTKWKTNFPTVTVKDLPFEANKPFTPYFIRISSVNRLDKSGPEGEKKEIHVKRVRNIVAPGIDSITVED